MTPSKIPVSGMLTLPKKRECTPTPGFFELVSRYHGNDTVLVEGSRITPSTSLGYKELKLEEALE